MRLTLDLRFEARERAEDGERLVAIGELAEMARRPKDLARLLWGQRWDDVVVQLDPALAPSGVQAGAIGLAALARARSFDGGRRLPFLARAIVSFVRAMPAELLRTRRLLKEIRAANASTFGLPRTVRDPASVLYLRTEPKLRWHGQLVGGASTHTTGVINGFAANGLDVEVFAAERPEWTEGVGFTEVPMKRLSHLVYWLTLTDYGDEIVRAAEQRRADFVYQRYSMGTYAGLELARRMNVPLVLEYNGSELWIQKHWGSGREIQMFDTISALEEHNVREASLIVVVSDVLKEQLTGEGIDPARVLVNPNGVDVDRVERFRSESPAHWRADAGLSEAPTIGFVGSFGLWHGVKVLPAMAEHLAALVPEARWVLIGDGPLHAEVRDEIAARGLSDRVEMTGIVPHERALALLAASDVCVSPHVTNPDGSRFFGSPTKLFEYMGLGKPIVASDLEQLGEVLDHERTALLCTPGDAEAAAAGVARLLGDAALCESLGAAALEEARTRYSWEAHTRRILEALAP